MFRGSPEQNRICSIADRNRTYKMHIDTLRKIKGAPSKPSPTRPRWLIQRSRIGPHEIQKRIPSSPPPEPMVDRTPIPVLHSPEMEIEHQRQVMRLMSSSYNYRLPTQVLKAVCPYERQ